MVDYTFFVKAQQSTFIIYYSGIFNSIFIYYINQYKAGKYLLERQTWQLAVEIWLNDD